MPASHSGVASQKKKKKTKTTGQSGMSAAGLAKSKNGASPLGPPLAPSYRPHPSVVAPGA